MSVPRFHLAEDIMNEVNDTVKKIERDTLKAVEETTSKETILKTNFWINQLKEESFSLGFGRDLLSLPENELNAVLASFLLTMKRKDGKDYEVSSIQNMYCLTLKYFRENNYPSDLESHPVFKGSRDAKSAKLKKLKLLGQGNRPNRSESITFDEEDQLWQSGQLGYENPMSVLRTIWLYLTMLFGLRGRHEARQMRWGDVKVEADASGRRYLKFMERLTKTRTGEGQSRAFIPKAFESQAAGDGRCPVQAYEEYAKRRPPVSCVDDAPFFLAINHQRKSDNPIWFSNAPLGVNKLGSLLASGCHAAGIKGKKTNHSARKTAIQRTLDAGCPPAYVAQMSGHKSVSSLANYTDATVDVQRAMSLSILEGAPFEIEQRNKRQKVALESSSDDGKIPVNFRALGQLVFNNCSGITINMK